jgi:hypothetical protein
MTRPALLAWSLCALALALVAVGVVLHVGSWNVVRGTGLTPRGFAVVLAVVFAVVGAFVASRVPHNSIGWIFAVSGLAAAAQYGAEQVAYVASAQAGSTLLAPAAIVVLILGATNSISTSIALLFLFPTGRFLGRRDRIVGIAGIGSSAAVAIGMLTVIEVLPVPFAGIMNPLARQGAATLAIPLATPALIVAIGSVVMGVRTLVVRFRRSKGVERQQLKWFVVVWTLAGITLVLTYVALTFFYMVGASAASAEPPLFVRLPVWLNIATFVLIAPALGVAILRYHLYDIDLLVNRALVYGATTAGIAVAFLVGIVVLQAVLRPLTNGSELAVAASTLASFALFQPLRRRMQDAVDRRFYRARYDAGRTLDAFSARLRDEVDLEALRAELVGAVHKTLQPAHADVWFRERVR